MQYYIATFYKATENPDGGKKYQSVGKVCINDLNVTRLFPLAKKAFLSAPNAECRHASRITFDKTYKMHEFR